MHNLSSLLKVSLASVVAANFRPYLNPPYALPCNMLSTGAELRVLQLEQQLAAARSGSASSIGVRCHENPLQQQLCNTGSDMA
jgi:hypothetical protein